MCARGNSRKQQRSLQQRGGGQRRGAVIVLSALLMVAMLGMVAFSVDVGYVAKVNSELKRAADAGALAGAASLVDGAQAAQDSVREFVAHNSVGGEAVPEADINIELGHWDPDAQSFSVDSFLPSAVRVVVEKNDEPLFFARVLNQNSFDTRAEAIAMEQPRDIMLVLDYSGSMCYDSQLRSLNSLGRDAVEGNLYQMWGELGFPQHGSLGFDPTPATFTGMAPTDGTMAQITVKFDNDHDVYVTSTKNIDRVRLRFSNGKTQTFYPGGTAGTFKGSGSNNNRQIDHVWIKSGTNDNSGGSGEYFTDTSSALADHFGLDDVPYPYPSGSWSDFFNYVKSDSDVSNAGYRKSYGYLTWLNYLQEKRRANNQTPDLWKTSEQPLTAVKDAVDLFVDYLEQGHTEDRLGMSLYATTGRLESGLTTDMQEVATTCRQRQAAHYDPSTNISEGIAMARDELEDNARTGAFKMMVLMTDGQANYPGGTSTAKQAAINEAWNAASDRIPIVAISLGDGADANLMSQIADITGGYFFSIPGGQSVAQYQAQLNQIFKEVADNKPLKLVQ